MAYKNKEDQAAAARRHYELNKEKMKARAVAHKAKQKAVIDEYVRALKSEPCIDCGESYPYYVMQFDHIGTDKEFSIANFNSLGKTLEKVKAEIEKCELVCANCHAKRTWQRRVLNKEKNDW